MVDEQETQNQKKQKEEEEAQAPTSNLVTDNTKGKSKEADGLQSSDSAPDSRDGNATQGTPSDLSVPTDTSSTPTSTPGEDSAFSESINNAATSHDSVFPGAANTNEFDALLSSEVSIAQEAEDLLEPQTVTTFKQVDEQETDEIIQQARTILPLRFL